MGVCGDLRTAALRTTDVGVHKTDVGGVERASGDPRKTDVRLAEVCKTAVGVTASGHLRKTDVWVAATGGDLRTDVGVPRASGDFRKTDVGVRATGHLRKPGRAAYVDGKRDGQCHGWATGCDEDPLWDRVLHAPVVLTLGETKMVPVTERVEEVPATGHVEGEILHLAAPANLRLEIILPSCFRCPSSYGVICCGRVYQPYSPLAPVRTF